MGVLAHGNQGTMNNRDKYLGECVIFAGEQVCSSRMHAGIRGKVKMLMPGLHSRGHSTLTTWSASESPQQHLQILNACVKGELMSPPLHTHGVDFGDNLYERAGLELPGKLSRCCISQQVAECSLLVPASASFCAAVHLS